MTKATLETLNDSIEKIAKYLATEVPRRSEVATKQEMNVRFDQVEKRLDHVESDVRDTKRDVKLILDGMDSQVKEVEILKTEQVAIKSGLRRVEKRVDNLEKVH